jgi:hypothetical protein
MTNTSLLYTESPIFPNVYYALSVAPGLLFSVANIRSKTDSIINNENASLIAIALASITADICTYCAAARERSWW